MKEHLKNILRISKNILNIRVLLIALNKICFCRRWFLKCVGSGPPETKTCITWVLYE
jgi:hypothetical protein